MDAFVLSGGAAQGDFEVGALRRLFELGVKPALIAGTSVGAINGAKLAEGEGRGTAANPSGLAGLENIWLQLNVFSDMYVPNQDFDFQQLKQDLNKANLDVNANFIGDIGILAGIPHAGPALAIYNIVQTAPDLQHLQDVVNRLLNCQSIYTIAPINAKLDSQLNQGLVASSGIRLLLATVSLETGNLLFVNEKGQVLEADGKTPHLQTIGAVINPACQSLQNQLNDVKQELQSLIGSGVKIGLGGLISRANSLQQALDACQRAHPSPTTGPVVVDLVDGVMASASIPVIFMPTKLSLENCVDGGVRAVVPISAAITAGATRVFAIIADNNVVGPAIDPITHQLVNSFDNENFLTIGFRASADIMSSQILADNMNPAKDWGATDVVLIQPDWDAHDGLTIDPGLIRIRMAHGYMRADDAYQARQQAGQGYDPAYDTALLNLTSNRNTFEITWLRKQIWWQEFAANGFEFAVASPDNPSAPARLNGGPDPAALAQVRNWKRQLKLLVDQRVARGGAMPTGPGNLSDWWLDWEHHQFTPAAPLWNETTAFGQMTVKTISAKPVPPFTDGAPFTDGETVAFTFSAVDELEPGPDLRADILLNGVKQPGATGSPVSLTLKKQTHTEVVIEGGKPKTITVTTNPVIGITKTGFTPVEINPPMK